jgi:DNA repair protein RadC
MGKLLIKDIPYLDRPREKLMRYGVDRVSDAELLAILLRTGKKGTSAIELAARVHKVILFKKGNPTVEDLIAVDGIGSAKACEIMAAIEIGKRVDPNSNLIKIMNAEDIWHQMSDVRSSRKENFVVFYLTSRQTLIEKEIISVGTLSESLVHPREIFEPAINHGAYSIILAHNHPSGDSEPSKADIDSTENIKKAGEILGIRLVDHVIVTRDGWRSII